MDLKLQGGKLVITLDFDEKGRDSSSGKTNIHAGTGGRAEPTDLKVNGKPLLVNISCYTSKK